GRVSPALRVTDLHAGVTGKQILNGLNIEVPLGEVHAVMGPNGSGKSTLCHVLTGRPDYEVSGSAQLDGVELLGLPVDERARLGILQSFQYPTEIPGVRLQEFVLEAALEHGMERDEARDRIAKEA